MKRPATVVQDKAVLRLIRKGYSTRSVTIALGLTSYQVHHAKRRAKTGEKMQRRKR